MAVVALQLGRLGFRQAVVIQNLVARSLIDKHAAKRRPGFHQNEQDTQEYTDDRLDISGLEEVKGQNVVLFVEHDPVYTVGIRRKGYTDDDRDRLKTLGAEYVETNRGGLVTFHGPGQLVAYPIIYLKDFHLGLRQYIDNLERTIVETCSAFGVRAGTTSDTGVWIDDKKIAAIGRHVDAGGGVSGCARARVYVWTKNVFCSIPAWLMSQDVEQLNRFVGE